MTEPEAHRVGLRPSPRRRSRASAEARGGASVSYTHLDVYKRQLILIVVLGDVVAIIPMAALVAVMIMVSVGTFDWHSIKPSTLKRMPKSETAVMVITVAVVVATHNLAIGVIVGVFVAAIMFVRRVAHLVDVTREVTERDGAQVAHYTVCLLYTSRCV